MVYRQFLKAPGQGIWNSWQKSLRIEAPSLHLQLGFPTASQSGHHTEGACCYCCGRSRAPSSCIFCVICKTPSYSPQFAGCREATVSTGITSRALSSCSSLRTEEVQHGSQLPAVYQVPNVCFQSSLLGRVYQAWWGTGCCHTLVLLFGSGGRWTHSRDVGTFHFRTSQEQRNGKSQ
ncbi:tetraspanin-4 isoform X4 [Hirundo rustica]|uniref:tetraspanin-4 isoform X4 n=1 Tax=Hirundo rustica TaxID=43150 RepID=UPI002672B04D|nr:tetraspanin-4 isoform X4 [Hirundo rustica]